MHAQKRKKWVHKMYEQSVKSKSHQGLELLNLSYCWLGQPKTQQFSWLVEKERFKSRIQNGFLWVVPRIQLDVHYIYLPCLLVSAKFQQPHFWGQSNWLIFFECNTWASGTEFIQLPLWHCKSSPYNNLTWSGIHNLFYKIGYLMRFLNSFENVLDHDKWVLHVVPE